MKMKEIIEDFGISLIQLIFALSVAGVIVGIAT